MEIIKLQYKKGKIYTPSDDDFPPSKLMDYFETDDELNFHPDYEDWTAMRCIKSVTVNITFSQ